jgi:hypothetical protein
MLRRNPCSVQYVSGWRYTARRYLFSGVQRRDGAAVEGEEWLREARELYATAAEMYDILPDVPGRRRSSKLKRRSIPDPHRMTPA